MAIQDTVCDDCGQLGKTTRDPECDIHLCPRCMVAHKCASSLSDSDYRDEVREYRGKR
jgi:hypothetical protein